MVIRRYTDRFVYLALAVALLATVFVVADGMTFSDPSRVVVALGTSPVSSVATLRHGWDQPFSLTPPSASFAKLALASWSSRVPLSFELGLPIAILSAPLRI